MLIKGILIEVVGISPIMKGPGNSKTDLRPDTKSYEILNLYPAPGTIFVGILPFKIGVKNSASEANTVGEAKLPLASESSNSKTLFSGKKPLGSKRTETLPPGK
jgi:hypothetical protein